MMFILFFYCSANVFILYIYLYPNQASCGDSKLDAFVMLFSYMLIDCNSLIPTEPGWF